MSAEQLVHQSAVSRRLLPFAGNAAAIRQCCRDPAAARLETNGLRLAQIGNKPPLSRQIVEREQRRARIVGGEGVRRSDIHCRPPTYTMTLIFLNNCRAVPAISITIVH